MRRPRIARGLAAIVELCRIGRRELVVRFFAGELTLEQAWVAAAGAAVCIHEIAAKGEAALVDPVVAAARLERGCEGCPSRTSSAWSRTHGPAGEQGHAEEAVMMRKWYCGPALEPHQSPPTCGCLLATETGRADGEKIISLLVLPACATMLRSKACDQGRW